MSSVTTSVPVVVTSKTYPRSKSPKRGSESLTIRPNGGGLGLRLVDPERDPGGDRRRRIRAGRQREAGRVQRRGVLGAGGEARPEHEHLTVGLTLVLNRGRQRRRRQIRRHEVLIPQADERAVDGRRRS